MDGSAHSISPKERYAMRGAASAQVRLGARQRPSFADDRLIVAAHCSPLRRQHQRKRVQICRGVD